MNGTQIILLSTLFTLIVVIWGTFTYRKWLREQVARASTEMAELEQDLTLAETEMIKYSGTRQKLGNAMASLEFADLTAGKTEEAINDLCSVPVPALPGYMESGDEAIKRLAGMMSTLEKNSLAVAAIEQVLLQVMGMPKADMLGHLVLSYYTGLLPESLQDPAKEVINNIVSGHIDNLGMLLDTAANIMNGVVHLYESNPQELVGLITSVGSGESLITHLLDGPHLEVYAQGLGTLAEHLAGSHDMVSAAGHLQHLDHLGAGATSLGHAAGGFDLHIPWITIALSTSREIGLLVNGKTTLGTSLKNAGLDVAGSGGGSMIGGLIGTVIFPGPGSVVGAVLGALGGRLITNKLKRKRLEEACQALENTIIALKDGERAAAHQAVQDVHRVANEKKYELALQIGPMPRLERHIKQQLVDDTGKLRTRAAAYLKSARAYVNRASAYAGEHWYRGLLTMLAPNLPQLTAQLTLVEGRVQQAERTLPRESLVSLKPMEALEQLSRLAIPLPQYGPSLEDAAVRAQAAIDPYRRRVIEWSRNATGTYKPMVDDLKPVIEQAFTEYNQKCDTLIKEVNTAAAKVEHERQVLGLK